MKKKSIFVLICGLILILPVISQSAIVLNQPPTLTSADLITDAYGNPEAIEISGAFLDNCTQITGHQVTEMDNTLLVQVFVGLTSVFCTPVNIPFTHAVEINSIPEGCTITVGLYNGTAAEQGVAEIYGDLLVISVIQNRTTGEEAHEGILVDIKPATLNLKSKGKYISALIDLPIEYDNENMILTTVKIGDSIEAKKIVFKKGVFIAKFKREELIGYLSSMDINTPTTVELGLEFQFFGDNTDLTVEAKDTIKILH